ncbi:MAG TPA: glycerol-3-phosphate dehydrogenase/oxidase [Tepidisphaeraceae bacterium]
MSEPIKQHTTRTFPTIADVDVLVIGGGIVGAGVARDAALRGLRCMLVEQNDFASGTSSRSSRLLHGGIRYLAQGRIGLVREASREKVILHKIAPHLATPLAFVFPTHRHGAWKLWKLRIGVKIYDLLCGRANLGKSSSFNREEILNALPHLNPHDLTGAVRYFDGFTNDARLVIDTLRSAANAGAVVLNYAKLADAKEEGKIWRCQIQDRLSGAIANVTTKHVINASGAWTMSFVQNEIKLRLTKGAHVVIDRKRLGLNDAIVLTDQNRILFAIPWGERTILGTTDTDYDGPLDAPKCEAADAAYILDAVNAAFLTAKITTADIIGSWAGIRPLIDQGRGKPSDISRQHKIEMPHPGWFDVAGGKLTTYRLMAEQTLDKIYRYQEKLLQPCVTAKRPLLEKPVFSGILPAEVSREAVEHFCKNEWVIHLTDVMIRRSSWGHYYADHAKIAEQVAGWMGDIMGWDQVQIGEEIDGYQQESG